MAPTEATVLRADGPTRIHADRLAVDDLVLTADAERSPPTGPSSTGPQRWT